MIIYGNLISSINLNEIDIQYNSLIFINKENGIIIKIIKQINEIDLLFYGENVIRLDQGCFLIPGFIDTHTHAPQYSNLGAGQQYELLDWLQHLTFPTEAKFNNILHAQNMYNKVVTTTINAGTTTCSYYGTLHLTTQILATICHQRGQRAFVGKCNMDRNASEDYVESSAIQSAADTRSFIQFVRDNCASPPSLTPNSTPATNLVQPIITPRFAIACSDELLTLLGEIADEDETIPIQTHLAENPSEIAFTKSLFPSAPNYTAVYAQFNLLRKNTILAHCVHLEDDEIDLIKLHDSGVSHCPTSNFNLRSGMSKVGRLLDAGVKVSLGTDVSGGWGVGILSAIRHASFCSKVVAVQDRENSSVPPTPSSSSTKYADKQLTIANLFYLATLGGAEVTCLADRIGNFVVGKEFDALVIDTRVGPMFVEEGEALESLFEKFLFTGDDRNIASVYVRGRHIGGTSFKPS